MTEKKITIKTAVDSVEPFLYGDDHFGQRKPKSICKAAFDDLISLGEKYTQPVVKS